MTDHQLNEASLRALADDGNAAALDRLADLLDSRDDVAALSDLLDEGSSTAGIHLTRRAVDAADLLELQRLADAGSPEADAALANLLRSRPKA